MSIEDCSLDVALALCSSSSGYGNVEDCSQLLRIVANWGRHSRAKLVPGVAAPDAATRKGLSSFLTFYLTFFLGVVD